VNRPARRYDGVGMSSPSSKPEYPPLLPVGRHPFTLEQLRALCVEDFPLSTTRTGIMKNLEAVVCELAEAKVCGELWIDGSFLTEKIDAKDVDLVLRVDGAFYDACDATQRAAMDWVGGNLSDTHSCDSYLHFEYAAGDPNYWVGEYMHAYWMKQWGFSRGGDMKGIAVVKLEI
jgi:hypothetical protein